jgi:hypothetical protein
MKRKYFYRITNQLDAKLSRSDFDHVREHCLMDAIPFDEWRDLMGDSEMYCFIQMHTPSAQETLQFSTDQGGFPAEKAAQGIS